MADWLLIAERLRLAAEKRRPTNPELADRLLAKAIYYEKQAAEESFTCSRCGEVLSGPEMAVHRCGECP